jgi:tRNA (guanine37-N1)-methyltransferase
LRKPKLRWLAGSKKLETIYRESNCIFELNVKTCFFSPRLATDRLDIARMCKPKEKIIVLFSGIAPYGIVIAKNARVQKVVCVEISKECSKYALKNVKLNRLWNVEIIQGDVKRICPLLKKKGEFFDRIIMGRPQLKETFLKEALMISKKGTIIHFQDFVTEEEIIKKVSEHRILDAAKKSKKKVKIQSMKFLRELAPRKHNVRVDFKIL